VYHLSKDTDEKLSKLFEDLNDNIQVLSRLIALTFRKASLFNGNETKPKQIEMLEDMKLPDEMIAIIIGSTTDSVKAQRSQSKAKRKKTTQIDPQQKTDEVRNERT
jgi:hypothetical protein